MISTNTDDIISIPAWESSGEWEGQKLKFDPGNYTAEWTLKSKQKGTFKGCKIRTYQFEFNDQCPEAFQSKVGEMTIHSRRSKGSLRSSIEMVVDFDSNGRFAKDEIMLSSGKEVYRVKDQITDLTASDYEDALSLRRLSPVGELRFDWEEMFISSPAIEFEHESRRNKNSFEMQFANPDTQQWIIC